MRTVTLLLSLLALPACIPAVDNPGEAPQRWNIVWIVADDMSPDIGAYGDSWARTPHLDRLAAEGVRFANAIANSPVCAPARATLHTGLYATSIGAHQMRSWAVPPPNVRPFAEALRRAGYYTSNNQKIDWNFSPHLEHDVMRAVREAPLGVFDASGPEAHWRNRDPGQPFFAVFDLFVTHESRIRLPEEELAELTAELSDEDRHHPEDAVPPPYYPDRPEVRHDWARYYDLVTVADSEVGRILSELEADGLNEETIVFFFSDHGRGLPRAKRWLYDSGIRVPLIVRWPGEIEAGSVDEQLVSFVDFAPTMLAIAGVDIPETMQGRPFLGPASAPEPELAFAYRDRMDETYDNMRAVRSRGFKYIRNFEPEKPYAQPIAYMDRMPSMQAWREWAASGPLTGAPSLFMAPRKPAEELYELGNDPHEIHNLVGDRSYGPVLGRMRAALELWQQQSGDLGMQSEAELIAAMRPEGGDYTTAKPVASPPSGRYPGPLRIALSSPTEGAAIVYTIGVGDDVRWRLYTDPIELAADTRLRFKAGRLGFFDSAEVEALYELGDR